MHTTLIDVLSIHASVGVLITTSSHNNNIINALECQVLPTPTFWLLDRPENPYSYIIIANNI